MNFILITLLFGILLHNLANSEANDRPKRPQHPKKPFPYIEENIRFKNSKANIELAGTLTYPNNIEPRACVVLAHGSGGLDRDETIAGHKVFMVLADHLTRQGIAVLRFDERGIGESTGNFTEARDFDFANDTLAGLSYLKKRKEFKKCKYGIVGHSKGGLTSMIAANKSKQIKFIVLLASPAINGRKLINIQNRLLMKAANFSDNEIESSIKNDNYIYDIVMNTKNRQKMKEKIRNFTINTLGITSESSVEAISNYYSTPLFKDMLKIQPKNLLRNIKVPVLGLWGSKDLQVPADINLQSAKCGLNLAKNPNFKLLKLDNLNHLFQTANIGNLEEYYILEETFSPFALQIISEWINSLDI